MLTVGTQPTVDVRVTNATGAAATLYAWIDYNADGVFDNATSSASIAVPNGTSTGIVTLVFPAVPSGFTGATYTRFRLSTDAAAANPTGAAGDGEVEDYQVEIALPANGVADPTKSTTIGRSSGPGPYLADGALFGTAAVSVGDLDNDGVNDLAVGSPRRIPAEVAEGCAHLVHERQWHSEA